MFTKDKNEKSNLPSMGDPVLVQCKNFRCLAYWGADGKWWGVYNHEELKDVIKVLSSGDAEY